MPEVAWSSVELKRGRHGSVPWVAHTYVALICVVGHPASPENAHVGYHVLYLRRTGVASDGHTCGRPIGSARIPEGDGHWC